MGNYSIYRRNTVIKDPKNTFKNLGLDKKSCWQLFTEALLDSSRPLKNGQNNDDYFKKLINRHKMC